MDKDLEGYLNTLRMNDVTLTELPAWAGDLATLFVTENNVKEMLKLLGSSETSDANLAFWRSVNEAPDTDEEWIMTTFVGGGVTETSAQLRKAHFRRCVEATRRYVGGPALSIHALFNAKK